ncbi:MULTISPECIES: glycosyltransferase [Enterococcus]|uniref:glycosyltransferase n=1 Tax=Enterococcus TaxID=1350 RepID=UPI000A3367CA|nr:MULTISPECIES: glycosyltransferase [Enterococcus]EGP5084684.1 glycosyltransferase family 1 protein [Enterococcus faecium]EGP5338669.1 glycosyltransferase [Enterococcus faecium]EME7105925.1 glycosyltransferase [Enterococcus faecium]EMF0418919.1 glycosyltransferase [Enterococcus faecium]MCO5533342.1 glycosyltransferase [Enterococcus faecium]
MKPRVLNITAERPSGGVETVIRNFEKNFDESIIFDFLFFGSEGNNKFDKDMREHGRTVHILPAISLKKIKQNIKNIDAFFSKHIEEYNILHVHHPNIAFLISPIASKYGFKIIIGHSHATKYSDKKISALRNFFLLLGRKKFFSNFIGCSNESGAFLAKGGQYKLIKNAIEAERFSFNEGKRIGIRKELHFEDKFVMGCIGRFTPQKNQEFLLKVARELINNDYKNFLILLIGEGPDQKKLENKIVKMNLSDYVMIRSHENKISDFLNSLDLILMPSKFEGFPMVAIESLANGLDLLLSDKITKDLTDEKTSFLSIRNTDVWVRKIIEISNKTRLKRNENKAISLGYDIKIEQKELIFYYQNLLEQNISINES